MTDNTAQNTDRELWREMPGDPCAPSLHVTESGGIGINVGGRVFVKPVREWHCLAVSMRELERECAAQTVQLDQIARTADFKALAQALADAKQGRDALQRRVEELEASVGSFHTNQVGQLAMAEILKVRAEECACSAEALSQRGQP